MKEVDLSGFSKSNKQDWLQLAQNQLKGEDPKEKLSWNSHGLVGILPYYDEEDLKDLSYLADFFEQIDSHEWKLYEKVEVEEEVKANKQALAALAGGCDGIIFRIKKEADHSVLFKDINLQICDISILSDLEKIDSSNLSGFIKSADFSNCLLETKIHDSCVEQVIDLLGNYSDEEFIHRTAFPDFFIEVATIRALRYYLGHKTDAKEVRIHSAISKHSSPEHQWFLNTTAGIASIIGGSHSIDMPTATGDSRITRNIGNLIREESGISQYTDQCGGSYLVEVLTHKIIVEVENRIGK